MQEALLLRFIAVIEILGGVWGLLIMLYRMTHVLDNLKFVLFLLFYLIPFALSILAGILLLKNKMAGLNLSLVVQLLQIPYFTLSGLYYSFMSGLLLGIRISFLEGMTNYNFNLLLGGYCQIQTGLPVEITLFGINIFALLVFVFLFFYKLKRE
ncbi:MAG: hypothetical protein DRH06_02365 [Deltaproteobacteria bacterium]|nr:MAG: hypothetical protein DRH06_02365 [Deltaproteobacteria bacterium]